MLHGRESLIRLIGKRRRTFFSALALSLRPQDDVDNGEAKPVNSKENEPLANGGGEAGIAGERGSEACAAEWVSCPVCAASVRGDDFSVNSHIDACLARVKKRKLSQRTLLQVNFLSKSRGETCLIDAVNLNVDKCEKELSEENKLSNLHHSGFLSLRVNRERRESAESINPSLCNSESGSGTSMLEIMDEDYVKSKTLDPHFPSIRPSIIRSPRSDSREDKDTKHVSTLETFIVGRRFHEKMVLQHGTRVYALRERQNAKDDNAIKVFCEDQGCRCPLGYLPRQLAKYLSPLIDNHHLKCEGSILSLPEHPLDAVPIILFFEKVVQHCDDVSEYQQDFESLWEKVLFANESTKSQPTSMFKYQQNFRIMLEDVLGNNSHLFTSEEKYLIGSFSSLSDDAQRLLIRLYTRKGSLI